ncbi:phosphatidate cytidylyltransferase [bacterium]|nr:phosphatidate cytidylyltransferase [bacterium]
MSSLIKRILVSVIGIPLVFLFIWMGGWYFTALIVLICVLAQREYYQLCEKKGTIPMKTLGMILGAFLAVSFKLTTSENILVLFAVSSLLIMAVGLFRKKGSAILDDAVTIGGLLYPTILFAFLILIRESGTAIGQPDMYGAKWLFSILIATWICDTAAYFIGSAIGKHKLFQRVSPNKTIEGAIAGLVFAIITMWIINMTFFPEVQLQHLLIVGAICGSFGQLGDLVESKIKRDAAQKDSSNLLPGHGGLLDRFDTLFMTAPIIYFYIKFIIS